MPQFQRDKAAGLPDAPWPPCLVRQAGEEPRVPPSKRRAGPKTALSGATNVKSTTRGPREARGHLVDPTSFIHRQIQARHFDGLSH